MSLIRALCLLTLPALQPLVAEAQPALPVAAEVEAGGEIERYLRVLQSVGAVPVYPWSLRGFSAAEVAGLAPAGLHPWGDRYDFGAPPSVAIRRPSLTLRGNSRVPWGENDGPAWAGRGLTLSAIAGIAGRWGPVEWSLAPVAFVAQNAAFPLFNSGRGGDTAFAHGPVPTGVDAPQRFGAAAYGRLDPGESRVRLSVAGVALGASTAAQVWGPGGRYPLILGANAGGYPHLFLGTARARAIGIGRAHLRFVWGRLEQSPWSLAVDSLARRFAPGLVAVYEPRGLPGLEIGGARFFHVAWGGGPRARDLFKPLEGILKQSLDPGTDPANPNSNEDNQLAALFARWVFPGSGLDLAAEYAREDHSWDLLDLSLEPDHTAAFALSLARTWRRGADLTTLRLEHANGEIGVLAQGRQQARFYTHTRMRQGHTHRGQVLGAPAILGGGSATTVTLDRYHAGGRFSLHGTRWLRLVEGRYLQTGTENPRGRDVALALGADGLWFRGRLEISAGATAVYERHRDFRGDLFNLSLTLGARTALGGRDPAR